MVDEVDSATRAGRGRERRLGVGRQLGLTFLGTLIPGAGLAAAGRRAVGGLLLTLTAAVLATAAYIAWRYGLMSSALNLAVRPNLLRGMSIGIAVAAVIWVLSIIATAVATRPHRASRGQGVLASLFVLLMCFVVVAPSAQLVRYLNIQHDVVNTVFRGATPTPSSTTTGAAPEVTEEDPWANTPRVNVLLLGSDFGPDRTGVRTDSMMVASIDTKSGNTVLFGIPRNLQNAPFPKSSPLHRLYPYGYTCGSQCLMNAVWQLAEENRSLFPGDEQPGLTATRDTISEVLGLRIDNTVIIDLAGFSALVDAMGGVTVTVHERIPIGGEVTADHRVVGIDGWIEKGRQKMNGRTALWFARSRATTDDYSRMRRQRCMVGAIVSQVNPVTMLERYPQLADVAKKNIQVDIAAAQLPAWVDLVQRIQDGHILSLPFTEKNVSVAHPDFAKIRSMVRNALAEAVRTPTATPSASTTKKPTGKPTTDPAVQNDELVEVKTAC